MNKPKNLTKPNKLFEDGPDWILDKNLGHWYCEIPNTKFKAFIWEEDLADKSEGKLKKLSKSNAVEEKIMWDGFCIGVPGGPNPSTGMGPILKWIREGINEKQTDKGT